MSAGEHQRYGGLLRNGERSGDGAGEYAVLSKQVAAAEADDGRLLHRRSAQSYRPSMHGTSPLRESTATAFRAKPETEVEILEVGEESFVEPSNLAKRVESVGRGTAARGDRGRQLLLEDVGRLTAEIIVRT
jgi:hypothetical protein